jgi:CubicO group peptidase (beta-lactamase class C family)
MNPLLGALRPEIHGHWDARFQAVADQFEQAFTTAAADGEVGATCAVMLDGELVVDLWGGFADVDRASAWQADTLVGCWSVSKALCATLTLLLVEQGKLDLDAPVARYWPAFGAHGKAGVLVRHLLDQRAGLCVLAPELKPGDAYDWDTMVAAIQDSPPLWAPGTQAAYHNLTYGYLLGELCARVNGGRRLGQFLREDLAQPLNLDWHFGLTDAQLDRVATVYRPDQASLAAALDLDPDSLFVRSMQGSDPDEDYNSPAWRQAEMGSGSGHGNARAMARLFGCLARGGELGGTRILSEKTLAPAAVQSSRGVDPVMGIEMRFSTGFELACPPVTPMGPSDQAFGYIGAGGAFGFADPSVKLGFGYSPNFMHLGVGPGRWGLALSQAAIDAAATA